jgi:hypothetical protein
MGRAFEESIVHAGAVLSLLLGCVYLASIWVRIEYVGSRGTWSAGAERTS